MINLTELNTESKDEVYRILNRHAATLFEHEHDYIANAANLSSLIYHSLPVLNWTGFYFHKDGQLVLGPFQGKPACIRIEIGKGVCGTAAVTKKTILVPDVHNFPGHIACDKDSRSEIVIPIFQEERLLGVLDLDSPVPERFDEQDQTGLEALAGRYSEASIFVS
jgi:L-methionine (R)-S-oxide reductase